ncbi:hypothetical protein N9L47_08065 [Rhodobacteraceae bacterium]|nr:hypothetical protein [Paracoccaceae bacterium]
MSDKITQRLRLADEALRRKNSKLPDFAEDEAYIEPVRKDDANMIRMLANRASKSEKLPKI